VEILGNLLDVWRDLTEAYHGRASHGYEAEIYAYKFIGYSPFAGSKAWVAGLGGNEPLGKEAARSAHEIFSMYERRYNCVILISGQKGWTSIEFLKDALFDHRIQVKVVDKNNLARREQVLDNLAEQAQELDMGC
jgi:hypothetical protein